MKIYQISYDTIMLTIILDDENISEFLMNHDSDFFIMNGEMYYKWDDFGLKSQVYIEDMTEKRGIIHSESH